MSGAAKRLSVKDIHRCVGCQCCMFACARRSGKGGLAESSIFVRSAGGMESGFAVVVCRACSDPPCVRVCPTNALLVREGGGVIFETTLCIGCTNCVDTCPFGAIFWNSEQEKPLICVYCGYCVSHCPYDVIILEERQEG